MEWLSNITLSLFRERSKVGQGKGKWAAFCGRLSVTVLLLFALLWVGFQNRRPPVTRPSTQNLTLGLGIRPTKSHVEMLNTGQDGESNVGHQALQL